MHKIDGSEGRLLSHTDFMDPAVRGDHNPTRNQVNTRDRLLLLYHEVRGSSSEYSYVTDAAMFRRHASLFAELQRGGDSLYPELTFDDGHTSNLGIAAPILGAQELTARFFITAGWTGTRPGFMGWSELRELAAAGHSIGAHGWSHKLLTHCSDAELETELKRARLTLEDGLGSPVKTMSLPGGRADARVLAACRLYGYTQIFTSEPKPEKLPLGGVVGRFNVRGDMQPEWLAELLRPRSGVLRGLERQHRLKSLAQSLLGDTLYAKLWALKNRKEVDAADHWDGAE